MRIVCDTNIVLDVLLEREQFYRDSSRVLTAIDRNQLSGFLCATTITTIHYIVEKARTTKFAADQIARLIGLFEVAPVNKSIILAALAAKVKDFEDAVIVESAIAVDADGIVSRDKAGFKNSPLPILLPGDLLKILEAN
ncbi:MAG: PIN domain-containing protein [Candidatus Hydrogenedentota bacterium]